MSQGDESDNSFPKRSVEDTQNTWQPLRKPRVHPTHSSDDSTESPKVKSVLQMKKNRANSAGNTVSAGAFFKVEKAVQARSNFVLRPEAEEFIPKVSASVITLKTSSVQDRLKKENLSDKYKRNSLEESNFTDNSLANGLQNIQINDEVRSIVETLENFVFNLSRDPGLYYKVEETFMSFLNPYFNDPQNNIMVISDTASMLFMHSVANPNFRYSGAKLCITIAEYSPEFQANLLLLCEKDVNCNTENIKGLLLFIAELYMNKKQNSKMYGNMLVGGFEVLLSVQTEDNVVATCQVLKLTGSKFSVDLPANLEEVLERLEDVKPSMRNNIQCLIESVKNNCQIQLEETANSDPQDLEPKCIPGMEGTNTTPILIGQDGIEIGIDDESFSGDDDSDMEEMCAQYEEFLKMQ